MNGSSGIPRISSSLAEHEPEILAYFAAREEKPPADAKGEVPEEVKALLSEIGSIEKEYHKALGDRVVKSVGGKNPTFRALVPLVDEGVRSEDIVADSGIRGLDGREVVRVEKASRGRSTLTPGMI